MPLKNETKAKIVFGELTLKEAFRAVKDRCNLVVVSGEDGYSVFREQDGFLKLYSVVEDYAGLEIERCDQILELKQKVKINEDGSVELDGRVVLEFQEIKTINLLEMAFEEAS